MKEYHVHALYTVSVEMTIEANSYDEAMEIAERCDDCISTEWNGNSVFVDAGYMDDSVTEMTLDATGTLREFSCEDYDDEEEE